MTLLSVALLLSTMTNCPDVVVDRYVPGQVIVTLTPDCRGLVNDATAGQLSSFGVPELDRLGAQYRVTRIWKLMRSPHPKPALIKHDVDLMYLVEADPSTDALVMMRDYAACPRVAYAGPNTLAPLLEVPNDPLFAGQWHLTKIQAPDAWNISHGDSTVRIGVIDNGCDYTHPDAAANVWINNPEDINHNHRFDNFPAPGGDLDGIDQDQNNYADDVIGYDFLGHTPDPMPQGPDNHGMHCWGISDAVTDNDTGVASIAWGCRGVGTRCGSGDFVNTAAAIEGLTYCINEGVWVTSHSYGSLQSNQQEAAVMQAAVDQGGLVVAAAGNDGDQTRHYPGAYEACIAVAASDQSDHRASWSCYGDWIEVAAPGVGILSTVPGSGYITMDGTSMATPLVAGLCALIKASQPSLTNVDCQYELYNGCDTMPDPDYRAGLMGHGRINAMKSLAVGVRCWLDLTGSHLNDANHNGTPEPGEEVGLTITLHNSQGWQNATGVSATLSCSDPGITITKSHATFPDIPSNGDGSCAADSFVFHANDGFVPHNVRFRIDKTATPPDFAGPDYLTIPIGLPRILLVDDHAGSDIAKWYRYACDSLRVRYDQYDVNASGAPGADSLRHYAVVIWFTGSDSTNLLSGACQTSLSSFLDNGGRLLICGQNIGQAIGGTPFYGNYLKAQLSTANTGKLYGYGVPGDPISHTDSIAFLGSGGAGNAHSCDGIKPIGGGFGCFTYRDYPDTTVYAAIRYVGNYKLVYFSTSFEAIDHAASKYVQKWTLLRRIFELFGEPLPGVAEAVALAGEPRPMAIVPNPASRSVRVGYSVGRAQPVSVRVYDTRGRLVKTLFSGSRGPGLYRADWDLLDVNGRAVANGVYFCSVRAGAEARSGKVLVTR